MRKLILSSILLMLTGCGNQPHLKTLAVNREGNVLLTKQNYQAANERYIEALSYNPFLARLHSNLGLSFEGLQQMEKAQQSYAEAGRIAEQSKDAEMMFVAYFNEAQLLGKAKKVDEAIAKYQEALEIVPASKEAKTNIELLIQSQQGGGQGDSKDQKDQGDKGNQQQQNKDQKGDKDQKQDQKDQDGKDGKDQKKDQQYSNSPKYKPRPFAGKELSEGDVKKILGEIKQQESKIRADYNRKETKEQPRDKDW